MALKKSMHSFMLLASAIAGIVGSGWLLGPLACAKIAGPAASITWLIAGLLMIIVASSFVLLTRALPITGGTVRFFQLSYGHFAGFSISWIAWLAWVAVSPIETMALIQYSSSYIPHLMTTGSSPALTPIGIAAAAVCMLFFCLINYRGLHLFSRLNYISLAFKLCIPIFTVILLWTHHFSIANFHAGGSFLPYGIQSIFSALPLAGVIYSFIGFNPAIQMAAETINPRRAIPIAIFGSLIICIILYTLIQVAFIGALPASSLQHGWQAISYLGDHAPFAGLLTGLGFIWFVKALYLDAVVSPFGTAMVQSTATSRMTYAMSENGYFPSYLMKTNQYAAPKYAILLNTLVGLVFLLPFPSWQHMVGFLVSCLVLGYIVGPMALSILAKQKPHQFGNIPRWLLETLCLLAFYICNLMIFWSGWDTIYKITCLFVLGYVVLVIKILWKKQSVAKLQLNVLRGSWIVVYIAGISIISYFGSFGGHHQIPFGSDFIILALFTLFIYVLAQYLVAHTQSPITHSRPDIL